MTLGKDIAFFHAMAELKQITQAKNLMIQILMRKRANQIVK